MRQLLPDVRDDFDPTTIISRESHHVGARRPWVVANMVMSADGAYASSGTSRAISSDADREMFHLLRATSDVILVGAGTARAERYRRPSTPAEYTALRGRLGLTPAPRLAVVSRTASFPPDQPFLTGEGEDPVVFVPRDRELVGWPDPVELRRVGADHVDLMELLASLYDDGARVVLCEGGPHLLGELVARRLLDEYYLTLAPVLIGGTETGLLGDTAQLHRDMDLHRVIEADGHLMLTYRAKRDAEG